MSALVSIVALHFQLQTMRMVSWQLPDLWIPHLSVNMDAVPCGKKATRMREPGNEHNPLCCSSAQGCGGQQVAHVGPLDSTLLSPRSRVSSGCQQCWRGGGVVEAITPAPKQACNKDMRNYMHTCNKDTRRLTTCMCSHKDFS